MRNRSIQGWCGWSVSDSRTVVFAAVLCSSIAASPAVDGGEPVKVAGPARVGNGIPNGPGATVGRLFVSVTGLPGTPGSSTKPALPMEVVVTSDRASAEPITCSSVEPGPCRSEPGLGEAAVRGNPTRLGAHLLGLKLAAASYLPSDLEPLTAGSSFEMALEGWLDVGSSSRGGDPCELRLSIGGVDRLRRWAGDSIDPERRPYDTATGTGILLSDVLAYTFPGTLSGEVVENTGDTVVVALFDGDFIPNATVAGRELGLQPDPAAARAAGIASGAFFVLEVNYSGRGTPSRVFPNAASHDVEVVQTTRILPAAGPVFIRADCNGDGQPATLIDATFLLEFNFNGGRTPPCLLACDADGDEAVTGRVGDAIYILNWLFSGGPKPSAPFPACGTAMATQPPRSTTPALDCDEPPVACE